MRYSLLVASVLLLGTGCASTGQGGPANDITVTITNEYPSRVSAYAVWDNSGRIRLGDISSNRTRTFSTPRRGDRIALGLELVSAPSPGTLAGPRGPAGGVATTASNSFGRSEAIEVAAGEGIEWLINSTGSLAFRRVPPQEAGSSSVQP